MRQRSKVSWLLFLVESTFVYDIETASSGSGKEEEHQEEEHQEEEEEQGGPAFFLVETTSIYDIDTHMSSPQATPKKPGSGTQGKQ